MGVPLDVPLEASFEEEPLEHPASTVMAVTEDANATMRRCAILAPVSFVAIVNSFVQTNRNVSAFTVASNYRNGSEPITCPELGINMPKRRR